ncbi:MAG: acetate--CoA ligase [Pseudarcicella sp.]|nr:acetate--CoA ligase [Pseudarcicella sp.]
MNFQIQTISEYEQQYKFSVEHPEQFWNEIAQQFQWSKPWTKTLEWDFSKGNTQWFVGGQLNITENALDRHLISKANQNALIWEPNETDQPAISYTYQELYDKVCQFANVLKKHQIKKGDRVCIYMPMIPELAIAVLACARIGAIHSVIFAGFSAQAISDRVNDAQCKMVITSDGLYRGNKELDLKTTIDEALQNCPSVETVIVSQRTNKLVQMIANRDYYWENEMEGMATVCPAEPMDSEDPLFILYTSGSTGKPKGVVHTCGGYMIYATYTFANVFQYQPGDIHFCTADIGWITGHSYVLYGPLCYGATSLMFEGIPTYPDAGRFWEIIDKHNVTIFYTAPTAIRSLMSFGEEPLKGKKLTSLKKLGTVGEPINEEAWQWYHRQIGKANCPIADTWWQTETGGIMIANLAGITQAKPCFATLPLPGVQPVLIDEQGNEIAENNVTGNLCIKFPWPGIIRTTYNDHDRCINTYFSMYKNLYFTGDGSYRDDNGNYRITGRVDDVLNVSGHRIGTAEVENAINMHTCVIESAIVGYPHDIKGQGIYAFVIANKTDWDGSEQDFKNEILQIVSKTISPIAKPDTIQFVTGLPKTRSGKIMRRILRKIAEGDTTNLGDTSTLLDPAVVETIKSGRFS